MTKKPTPIELQTLFHYNPETGDLTWKDDSPQWWYHSHKAGDIAGSLQAGGYRQVNLNHIPQLVHRMIWAIVTGAWPKHQIDHINMIRTDNRWCNLRAATNSQNSMNRGAQSNNKSGMKGVHTHKDGQYFTSSIRRDGIDYYLGIFKTAADAKAAYDAAAVRLHDKYHRLN
jgi:hypothetical protein